MGSKDREAEEPNFVLSDPGLGFNCPAIHRAEWVVPVSAPPVRNGAVLTHGGRIMAVGPFDSVRKSSPAGTRLKDHGAAALFPATVNAHTHLELSALRGRIPIPQPGWRQWIELLFSVRDRTPKCPDDALRIGRAELLDGGTAFCGDVTNGGAVQNEVLAVQKPSADDSKDNAGSSRRLERQVFIELLGFNLDSVSAALPPGIDPAFGGRDTVSTHSHGKNGSMPALAPHSVYSVSPAIIAESKEWTRERGLPFSIHAAEHCEEIEFLQTGTGFCRDLLERLGRWAPKWNPPGMTPIEYLDRLGVLDSDTLLVHAVHMNESDWRIAAGRGCTAVFCPRSNRNIGSGSPQIDRALSLGMTCALGTDSLASNTDLNLFAEAAFTAGNNPSIDPKELIEMITVNPARMLGRSSDLGRITPGAGAHILAISIPSEVGESNLYEALIQSGKEGALKWAS
jgi:cytosine/adenosine deaminase-related metal-dependent hydrolase